MPGFLEARLDLADRFEHPTPLRLLVIDVQGELFVDWGDGTAVAGPFRRTGAPWPDGDITHVWTHVGHYDVVVTARWTGTWRLGDTTGELTDLVTEGVIDDFEIRELQAVRER